MRRYVGPLLCAGYVSLLSLPLCATPEQRELPEAARAVAVQRVTVPHTRLGDEATMLLVGAFLIGMAAAVRRAA